VILFVLLAFASAKAQHFDSLRAYAISMQSTYAFCIGRDVIDMKADPITIKDSSILFNRISKVQLRERR